MSEFEPPSLLLRDGGAVVGTPWRIIGELDEHEDISGIACDADGSGLLVTDEGSLVHRFELQRRKRRLKLSPLTTMLLREGEEADLEGLCCDGTWFYAAGSHALGRNVPDHQPSRHHLYRLRFAGDRLEHETSHSLEPMLENDRLLAGHFYKRLDSVERGVDIEGLAVRQDRLLIGLRGPALDGEAFVLSVPVEAVFGAKRSRLRTAERYALPLGEGAGVRDLATVQDGVLILGEKGLISTNINDSSPLMPKLYLNDGTTEFGPEVEENEEPEYGHHRKWVDACKAGFNSPEHLALTSSFDYAGPMTETVLMGNLAIRSYMLRKENSAGKMEFYARKKLLWDGENMKITNLEAANQFVGRTYRKGWEM